MSDDGVLRTIPDKAEKKYVQSARDGGWRCPCCGSDEMDWDSLDAQGSQVFQDVVCNNCGLEWRDVYELTGVAIKGFERIPEKPVQ